MILRGRTSKTGLTILGCCLASVAWAAATAASVRLPIAGLALFDSVRLSAWLLFAVALVTIPAGDGSGLGRLFLFGALAFCVAAIANDGHLFFLGSTVSGFYTSQLLVRIGFGVIGLLTIENLWRNTEPQRRWHVWPLCLALGGLFAYELFLFSDAFITRGRVDRGLGLGRAIRRNLHGTPACSGYGAKSRMAGRHSCIAPSGVPHCDLAGKRLFSSRCRHRRHGVAQVRRGLGACPSARDVVRQHCRPCYCTFFREPAPAAQVFN